MADDFADSIADQIRSLELSQLLAVCDQFNVDVPAEKKETRGAVVRLFNKVVNEKSGSGCGGRVATDRW